MSSPSFILHAYNAHLFCFQTWTPLSGTATLNNVINGYTSGTPYAAEGSSVESDNQFIVTEDSIEVVDILIVRLHLSVIA